MPSVKDETAGFSRRSFLRLAGAAGAIGIPALLAACGGSQTAASSPAVSPASSPASAAGAAKPSAATSLAASPSTATSGAAAASAAAKPASGKLVLPTRVAAQSVTADLPGSADGLVDPGFLNYPKNPPKSVAQTPGSGGDINITTWQNANGGTVTPVDQNAMWQAVNKELGANLKVSIAPFADYQQTRLSTIIAGGDLPDALYMAPGAVIQQLPDFLKAKAADLTPYLSGDNIKDYPNLANFPTLAWKNVIFNNAIYGVPAPYPPYLWVHWVHQELLDQAGIAQPKSADDYKKALMALTKPQQQQWGIGCENTGGFTLTVGHFSAIFGAPNMWRNDGGKLTYYIETDEFKAALSYTKDLYTAGVFNPNSLTYDTSTKRNDFSARRFAFNWDGFQQASQLFWASAGNLNPPGKYRPVAPFSADGKTKPVYWSNTGIFGYSILKQAPPEKIKEILRIMNYIAAPFGSHEYLLMHYGVEGTDYTLDNGGNPILTTKGKADTSFPWAYITQPPGALYYAGAPDYPQVLQDGEKGMFPDLLLDPTVGLYSNTFASKNGTLNRTVSDGLNAIVKGQDPLTNLDQIIKDWRSTGGDQMKTEFQQAMQHSQA